MYNSKLLQRKESGLEPPWDSWSNNNKGGQKFLKKQDWDGLYGKVARVWQGSNGGNQRQLISVGQRLGKWKADQNE